MADINKTIKDLDEQIVWIQDNDFHKFPGWGHAVLAMKDALKLLKEQQPMKPHYTTLRYIVEGKEVSVKHPECPKCIKNSGLYLWDAEIEIGQAFCKRCGQAIDWSKDGEQE